VSRYQKGRLKPIWILLKQETVSGSGISWTICKSAPRSRQITTPAPHHSFFYRPDALPVAQPTASKQWNWPKCVQNSLSTNRPPCSQSNRRDASCNWVDFCSLAGQFRCDTSFICCEHPFIVPAVTLLMVLLVVSFNFHTTDVHSQCIAYRCTQSTAHSFFSPESDMVYFIS